MNRQISVFLSYRRLNSRHTAIAVALYLEQRKFSTYLDTKDSSAGDWRLRLLDEIIWRDYFVVILSPGCLERCIDAKDVFRQEIECALKYNRMIIPLCVSNFSIASVDREQFGQEIPKLKNFQTIKIPDDDTYFTSSMELLCSNAFLGQLAAGSKQSGALDAGQIITTLTAELNIEILDERLIEAEREFAKGVLLYENGHHNDCIVAFTRSIELNSTNAETYFQRGRAYRTRKEDEKAINDFKLAADYGIGAGSRLHIYRSNLYALKKKYAEAIEEAAKAISLDVTSAEAWLNRGTIYHSKHDFNNASADYDKALSLNPHFATSYYHRARLQYEKREYQHSIADFENAINNNPHYVSAYIGLGNALIEQENYTDGVIAYSKALELNSLDERAYFNRGRAYEKLGKYRHAMKDYKEAFRLAPRDKSVQNRLKDPNFLFGYAKHLHIDNQIDDAINAYGETLRVNPTHAASFHGRGMAKALKGNYHEAINDYDNAIRNNPTYLDAYRSRREAREKVGDTLGADQDSRAISILDSRVPR